MSGAEARPEIEAIYRTVTTGDEFQILASFPPERDSKQAPFAIQQIMI